MPKILALDVGQRKIGVALGDTDTRLAFARPPLLTTSAQEAVQAVADMVTQESVATIVVGWPLNTDGSAGPQTEEVMAFVHHLEHLVNLPIIRQDERMTTQAVQREHRGQKLARGQEDSLAAQLLAETYLASLP